MVMTRAESQFLNQCLRKAVFRTRQFADKMAKVKGKEFKQTLRAYSCRYCGKFHLTSQPPHIKHRGEV